MSLLPPNPHPRNGPPDDLDRLFGNFFKSQMPKPWPAVRIPALVEPAGGLTARAVGGDTAVRSRLTLAVSAALLLGGGLYLSGQMGTDPRPLGRPDGIDRATANEKGALPAIREERAKKASDPAEGFVPGPISLP